MKIRRMPSMKEKKRYVVFRVTGEKRPGYDEVKGAVMDSALGWMGEKGVSLSALRLLRNLWDQERMEGWLSCTPKSVDDVKLSLALIHQIGDSRVIFRTVSVTGNIKSGKKKAGMRSLAF
ncbi:MAG: Rpp14/Pop5 family protein, partial [Candidatus Aenigmatarchaeota archaeon]